jgi:hypothetical protein
MNPETLITQLLNIITGLPDLSEDAIFMVTKRLNIPDASAYLAYNFIQVACGRIALQDTGPKFSPDYLCFDANGNVVASGKLADEPLYSAAFQLISKYPHPAFNRLALGSAEVASVNNALRDG